jgi:cellulose synthase/poly-beta-1,6-N-acetylglucosamine synthase-like glycosyltransferase
LNLVETIYRPVLWLHVSVTLLLVCLSSFLLIGCFLAFLLPKKKLQQPNPQQAICVLVPTFNSQATLRQCIESILNSNYPPQLIEVKILDDGSTDETLAYLDDLENQQHATKITVLRYTHRGKAAALQQTLDSPSLRNSSSEILFVVDSDTILSKDALSEMVVEFADPAVMACSALIQIREPKHLIEYLQQFEYCFAALTQLILERIFGTTGYLSGQTMAVRKSFLDQCGGIPQNLLTEDYSLFLKHFACGGGNSTRRKCSRLYRCRPKCGCFYTAAKPLVSGLFTITVARARANRATPSTAKETQHGVGICAF